MSAASSTPVITSQAQSSTRRPFSYQQVEGLKEIWVGLGQSPEATFVFETAAKANACAEAVQLEVKHAHMPGRGKQTSDHSLTDLLEVLRGENLSNSPDSEVLSYLAKQGGTVGKPMEHVHQLIGRLGKVMSGMCPAKGVKAIPIHAVDRRWLGESH